MGDIANSFKVSRQEAKKLRAQGYKSPGMIQSMRDDDRRTGEFENAIASWKESVESYQKSRKKTRSAMTTLTKQLEKATSETNKAVGEYASMRGL